jgi:hypothetical protein
MGMKNLKYLVLIGWVLILFSGLVGLLNITGIPFINEIWKSGVVVLLAGITWKLYNKKK